MEFDEWMRLGIEKGFCGPPVCSTHDGTPTAETEDASFDEGFDPCIHIIRPYEGAQHKAAVEANHGPSMWRDTYTVRSGHALPD